MGSLDANTSQREKPYHLELDHALGNKYVKIATNPDGKCGFSCKAAIADIDASEKDQWLQTFSPFMLQKLQDLNDNLIWLDVMDLITDLIAEDARFVSKVLYIRLISRSSSDIAYCTVSLRANLFKMSIAASTGGLSYPISDGEGA